MFLCLVRNGQANKGSLLRDVGRMRLNRMRLKKARPKCCMFG